MNPRACRLVDLAAPYPVAMATALLLGDFPPGCHGGEPIAQTATTLGLGWKAEDREQLVHQLAQAVRCLLETFRIPCVREGHPCAQIPAGDAAVLLDKCPIEPELLAAEAAFVDKLGRWDWLG